MKLKPQNIPVFINLCFNIVLGAIFTGFMLFVNGALDTYTFFVSFAGSFAVGFTVGTLLPAPQWGESLAKAMKLKDHGFMEYFVKCVIITICFVTVIAAVLMFINTPKGYFLPALLGVYPQLLLGGFIVVFASMQPLTALAFKLAGIPFSKKDMASA
ncbi:MAG: hypothetical protein ACC608_06930 [Anaerofustis sp.]